MTKGAGSPAKILVFFRMMPEQMMAAMPMKDVYKRQPLPFLPTYGRHFRLLNRSVKALAQQYGADYVSIPYTRTANDGHPTVSGHKYIGRQILKAVNY